MFKHNQIFRFALISYFNAFHGGVFRYEKLVAGKFAVSYERRCFYIVFTELPSAFYENKTVRRTVGNRYRLSRIYGKPFCACEFGFIANSFFFIRRTLPCNDGSHKVILFELRIHVCFPIYNVHKIVKIAFFFRRTVFP